MNRFKAVIFDMDGLLLDTEALCKTIFKEACKTLQIPFLEEDYLSIIGCNSQHIYQTLGEVYQDIIDYEILHQEWRSNYSNVVENKAIAKKPGVIDVLSWLKDRKIPLAVATSSQKTLATRKLELAGIRDFFQVITGGDEITFSKPDPEIYLKTASRLYVKSEECIVFEDSTNGVIAASKAGMRTYQVPDLIAPTEQTKESSYKVISRIDDSLQDLLIMMNLE